MNEKTLTQPVEILLVEDNAGDVRLIQEALKDSKVSSHMSVVGDGVDALAFVHRDGKHALAPRPDLIILDLNLPKKSGQDVLREIKSDPRLKRIPVVVLTTSKSDEDISETYRNHGNCFISKPVDLNQFLMIVKSIEHFWLTVAKLPAS